MSDATDQLPPQLLAYMQRRAAMAKLTDDEIVQEFWSRWDERTPGRLDLLIRGQISWESKLKKEFDVAIGWLRPTTNEPVDAETSFRMPSAKHEYGAGVPVADAHDAETALASIRAGISRANLMTDCLSFLTGFPVSWHPARILDVVDKPDTSVESKERRYRKYFAMPGREESTSLVVTDDFIVNSFTGFLKAISQLKPKLREILVTAISWQSQANRVGGFSRYLHYWASVELLATFFWDELPRAQTQRTPDADVRQRVLELLLDLRGNNYVDIVNKCNDVLDPSARTQVKALARLVEFDSDVFFQRATKDSKSIIDVRNDIAHGNVANEDRAYAAAHREVLEKYQEQTRGFVVRVAIAAAKGVFES